MGKAQVSWDTTIANDVTVCLKPELLRIAVTVASAGSGSYFDVGMPTGFAYNGIAYQNTPSGNSISYSGKFGNRHRFSISGTPAAGSILRLWILQTAQCGTIGSSTFNDTIGFFNGTSKMNQLTNSFNSNYASLSVTSVTNTPGTISVGGSSTRKLTVTNGGTGKILSLKFFDKFATNALSLVPGSVKINPGSSNWPIPSAYIKTTSDSIIITIDSSFFIAGNGNIGNADKYFNAGEQFEIQYQLIANNCGISNSITSNLAAWWGCSIGSCQTGSNISGLGITVSGAPTISALAGLFKGDKIYCFQGEMVADTAVYRNIGVGAATQIDYRMYIHSSGLSHHQAAFSIIDTANVFYKIGKNGALQHPRFRNVVNGTNQIPNLGCNYSNKVVSVTFTIPLLNIGDTLWVYSKREQCDILNRTCSSITSSIIQGYTQMYFGFNADLTYKNACGNLTFSLPGVDVFANEGINHLGVPIYQQQFTDLSPSVLSTNSNYTLGIDNKLYSLSSLIPRGVTEIRVTPPSGFVLSSSINAVRFVTSTGIVHYPWSPSSGIYRFKQNQITSNGIFYMDIIGQCNSSIVCGDQSWFFELYFTADSTNCSTLKRVLCLNPPVYVYSHCGGCPCPDGGLVVDEFIARRKNYGAPDMNNDGINDGGSLNISSVRNNYIVKGDTLLVKIKGHLESSITNPKFEYLYHDVPLRSLNSNWSFISANYFLDRVSGSDTSFSINPSFISDTARFDLSNLPDYQNNDTLYGTVMFIFTSSTADLSFQTTAKFFAGRIVNPTGNSRLQCGRPNITLRLIPTYYSVSGSNFSNLIGCNQRTFNYSGYLSIGACCSNYSGNMFNNEQRQFAIPNEHFVKLPTNYTYDSIRFSYNSLGANFTINYSQILPFITTRNDTVFFKNLRNLFIPYGGSRRVGDDGYSYNLTFYYRPNCKVPLGINVNTFHGHNPVLLTNNFIPVSTSGYVQRTSQGPLRYDGPQFIVSSSNPTVTAYSNTINWPITYTNGSSVNAPNNWLYFVNNNGNIIVDSVKLGSSTISPDSTGFFRMYVVKLK